MAWIRCVGVPAGRAARSGRADNTARERPRVHARDAWPDSGSSRSESPDVWRTICRAAAPEEPGPQRQWRERHTKSGALRGDPFHPFGGAIAGRRAELEMPFQMLGEIWVKFA